MFDNILYIIGNGFDIHHGVDSSFKNFRVYMKKNNYDLYCQLQNFFSADELWADFESNLGYLSRETALATAEVIMPNLKIDFEELQIADMYMPQDYVRETLDKLLYEVRKILHKWIFTLKANDDYDSKKVYIDHYARFLTFNYTTFLETKYNIEKNRINYIHGQSMDKLGSLTVGHGIDEMDLYEVWSKKIKPKYNKVYTNKKGRSYKKRDLLYNAYFNKNYYHPAVEFAVDAIEEYFSNSKKNTNSIIYDNLNYFNSLHNINNIYVLGLSLSPADIPYFKEIIKVNDNSLDVKWCVSYHRDAERKKMKESLMAIDIKESQIKMIQLNDILIN